VVLSAMNVEDDLAEQSSRYRGVIVVVTNETRRDKEVKIGGRMLSVPVQQSHLIKTSEGEQSC
jgi:hypothetical protein